MKLERKKEIEVNQGKIDCMNYAYSKENILEKKQL